MNIFVSQIYIEPNVSFPFSIAFQQHLGKTLTSLVPASSRFAEKYGEDWKLIFRVSAKRSLRDTEVKGPTVFRGDKSVEYTVFLPYAVIITQPNILRNALEFLLQGILGIMDSLQMNTFPVREIQSEIVAGVVLNPLMFK